MLDLPTIIGLIEKALYDQILIVYYQHENMNFKFQIQVLISLKI